MQFFTAHAHKIFEIVTIEFSIVDLLYKLFTSTPADTDVFKTCSGRLKKVTASYDQTRCCQDVLKKTPNLQRLQDVWFMTYWRRLIYDVLKKSNLHRLEDVQFMTSSRRLIYDILRTSDLRRLEDVQFTTSSRHL